MKNDFLRRAADNKMNLNVEVISADQFQAICHNASTKVIKYGRDLNQPKIFETTDATIIKLFYPKRRRFSSDKFKPYAVRFCNNIKNLAAHGLIVPTLIKTQFCAEKKIYLVHYNKLPGTDVRSYAKENIAVIDEVAKLIAKLHTKGIFFRSIHLENLLHQQDGQIALLDIVDVRFHRRALSLHTRYRNIKHMFQDENDKALWRQYGVERLLHAYFQQVNLSGLKRNMLAVMVKRAFEQEIGVSSGA